MSSKTDFTTLPTGASAAVFQRSDPIADDAISVQGPNFDTPLSLMQFLQSYEKIGFQANSFGRAINIVNKMVCS
jgi:deoxyhypusine synthase